MALLVALAFEGGYRQYRDLHGNLQAVTDTSEEEQITERLAKKRYRVGGSQKSGDELFRDLGIRFREALSEQDLTNWLFQMARNNHKPQPNEDLEWVFEREPELMARQILDDWVGLGLLDPKPVTTPGAPPSQSGTYQSRHAGPQTYSVYILNPMGISVHDYLKKLMILPSVRKAMSEQKPAS